MTPVFERGDATYFNSPDFVEVRATVFRLLQERKAVTWHALQYRVSELGTPQDRRDPRTILPAMRLRGAPLIGTAEPTRPWEPLRGVYVSPKLQDEATPLAVDSVLEAVRTLMGTLPATRFQRLAKNIQTTLSPNSDSPTIGEVRQEYVAEGLALQSEEWITDLSGLAGAPVIAAVTNDLDWLYPDDARLWRHLKRCRDAGAYPVFIARKASIATFPLMKQLSAIGIQLHQLYAPPETQDVAKALDDILYWPRFASLEQVPEQKGLAILRQLLHGATRSYLLQLAYDRIDAAIEMGMGDDKTASPRLLLDWVEQMKVEMPEPWQATLWRWAEWDKHGLLDKPYGGQPSPSA